MKNMKKIILILIITIISLIASTSLIIKNQNIKTSKLKTEISNLKYTIKTKNIITDSLLSILNSNEYLYYIIEKESSIKIPDHINPIYVKYMYEEAISKNIPIDIMFRLVYKESNFHYNAVSSAGAYGFMQLMPNTYKWYCEKLNIDELPYTEEKNIYVGTYMLSKLYEHWYDRIKNHNLTENIEKEAWEHTLASYNAGRNKVKYYGKIFNNKGVSNYITYITKNYKNKNL